MIVTVSPTEYLANLERDTHAGDDPAGWYPIRRVDLDGVRTVGTDTGSLHMTSGDYSREGLPRFAPIQNVPGRGPAWMRLVMRGVAYGAESDEARRALAEMEEEFDRART
jgi:hypothetical protein